KASPTMRGPAGSTGASPTSTMFVKPRPTRMVVMFATEQRCSLARVSADKVPMAFSPGRPNRPFSMPLPEPGERARLHRTPGQAVTDDLFGEPRAFDQRFEIDAG